MSACYIAGPMRGIVDYNYPAFIAAERALRSKGWGPIYNPARMDMKYDKEDYAARTLVEQKIRDDAESCRMFARRDLAIFTDKLRAEKGDAIVLLPEYEESTGATAERAVAIWVKLRVLQLATALRETDAKEKSV